MLFDFKTFSIFAKRAYNKAVNNENTVYPLNETLEVFRLYFLYYEQYFKQPHPNIRQVQIEHIIAAMPILEDASIGYKSFDVDLDCYKEMIPQHFKTPYKRCDYNINHFFSGDIRLLRFYETCF